MPLTTRPTGHSVVSVKDTTPRAEPADRDPSPPAIAEPLRSHAARLLTGTGLSPDTALAAARGEIDPADLPPEAAAAAAALADGWAAAEQEGTPR